MKRLLFITMVLLFSGTTLYAQHGQNRHGQQGHKQRGECLKGIDNLNDAQKAEIEKLRSAQMKTMLPMRNLLQEKKARLRTLETAENPDMKAIHALIDEMGAIKLQMAKQRANHQQKMRSLLTDEQRVKFDSRPRNGGHGHGKGFAGKGPSARQ